MTRTMKMGIAWRDRQERLEAARRLAGTSKRANKPKKSRFGGGSSPLMGSSTLSKGTIAPPSSLAGLRQKAVEYDGWLQFPCGHWQNPIGFKMGEPTKCKECPNMVPVIPVPCED